MKYKMREESLREQDIPVLLQAIANELAEVNRLKRISLKLKYPTITPPLNTDETEL